MVPDEQPSRIPPAEIGLSPEVTDAMEEISEEEAAEDGKKDVEREKGRRRRRSPFRETVELVVMALVLALLLRTFVVQAFRIPTGSMEDSLLVGDFILVDKVTYGAWVDFAVVEGRLPGLRQPRTGDIVVFKYPLDTTKDFIKRLIAGPGQTVEIKDRQIYVDRELIQEPPKSKHIDPRMLPSSYSNRDNYGPVTVPDGQYFFMGDNRENSKDSREWGFVPKDHIKGKALIVYLSWNPDQTIPWFNLFSKIRWGRLFGPVR
jgi:signal peptidase I